LSTNIVNGFIPQLNPNLKCSKFDSDYYVVESHKHQLKLKNEFYYLINLIDGHSTINQITELYNLKYSKNFTDEFILEIFQKQLFPYGVIESDTPIIEKEREIHLRLSFIFWKGASLNLISSILANLFNPLFFYITFISALCFNIIFLLFSKPFSLISVQKNDVFLFAFFSFLILILHELGHISACAKFNTKNKGIGFGFYIISPVFFADISDAWHLSKKKRIIINLAGIYIELLISTLIIFFIVITKNTNMLASVYAILFHVLLNLNPFLKYDGYWIISDLFGFSNLRLQSNEKFKSLLKFRKKKRINSKDLVLATYSIISNLLIFVFIYYIYKYKLQAIISFPYKIFKTFSEYHIYLNLEFSVLIKKVISQSIPFLFYFILIKYLYRLIKKYLLRIFKTDSIA
jgi:putative peptide zinc metalloprotease protein